MRALKFLVPLLIFVGISWFLLKGLSRDPREIPSPLVGKPAPAVRGVDLDGKPFDLAALKGKVVLIEFWAS